MYIYTHVYIACPQIGRVLRGGACLGAFFKISRNSCCNRTDKNVATAFLGILASRFLKYTDSIKPAQSELA